MPGIKNRKKNPQKTVVNSMHHLISDMLEFTHRYTLILKEWENKPCFILTS